MTSLSDAERDASDVVQALASLAILLTRQAADRSDPEWDDARRTLLSLAQDGNAVALRVLEYLRGLRGAGDGEAAAVPYRLGMWREWVPPRGHVLTRSSHEPRIDEFYHRRRSEPGE